ncbi:MAG: CHAT domain-containing protein, partial [Acidobacteria bacterium]|nr:CHAT domain-containing protein [Acidobacteriota bacterium]
QTQLRPAGGEDGLFQAREILDIQLNADLVTLSACDTRTGTVHGQEGVASLVRPFLAAGARTVVANLWDADDVFSLSLMRQFYRQLATGADVGQSLRLAKLRMRQQFGPIAVPKLWSGILVSGDAAVVIGEATATRGEPHECADRDPTPNRSSVTFSPSSIASSWAPTWTQPYFESDVNKRSEPTGKSIVAFSRARDRTNPWGSLARSPPRVTAKVAGPASRTARSVRSIPLFRRCSPTVGARTTIHQSPPRERQLRRRPAACASRPPMRLIMFVVGRPEAPARPAPAPAAVVAPTADRVRDDQDRLRALEAQSLLSCQINRPPPSSILACTANRQRRHQLIPS